MVSIVTKKIKGKEYLYLVKSKREGKRVIQKTIKYIGKKRPVPQEEFDCMNLSYSKKDWILEGFKDELSYQDHEKMRVASNNYKNYLKNLDKVSKEKEKEKFLSAFITDSNALEGSTITKRETYNFLFKDISPQGYKKKELFMAKNLLDAWNYIEKNYKRLPKEKDLFELHKLVNKDIEDSKTIGKFKKVQNYIGEVHTSSYLFVEDKIKEFFYWIKKALKKINDFEVAFQSHAQFEIIHPFVDGNGRVGRLLINWLLMYKGLMPLAISVKDRGEYLEALNNSRKGKIKAICEFCKRSYLKQYKFANTK